jgi:hypothetical protein
MSYFRAYCPECDEHWYQPCFEEHGCVVPEEESCNDCGSTIEIDTEDEYTPAERWADEREGD